MAEQGVVRNLVWINAISLPDLYRLQLLVSAGRLVVVVAGGVRDEVQHPRAPADVKDPCFLSISIFGLG